MATIGDLSGDEREQRAAELKRKMQEAAKRARAARGEESAPAPAVVESTPPAVESTPVVTAVADGGPETATLEAVAVAEHPPMENEGVAAPAETPLASNGQGATAAVSAPPLPAAAPVAAPVTTVEEEEDPEAAARREMNRREFLMYSWGAALGLLTLQGGVASFLFLYPRFREGEFGGNFIKPLADFADPTADPNAEPTGKFWMVTTQTGEPKAIYMVCTHLGCLYKWVGANNRFECPCHGSKFSHDGHYIEGPAPRSLDFFEITQQGDQMIVNTGRRILGDPAAESPARAVPA